MSTSRRTPTPSAFLNANQSGDGNQTEISNSTFGFCFFLRHSKTLHCYTRKHIIRYRVALRYGWEIWSFLLLLCHFTKKIVCNRCRTEMHKNLSHDVCKRIHYIFHEKSQWSCSQHSLTKTENFAVFFCYAPLRAPSPSTYNKKNDTSSFATTRVVVAKETTPSVCFSQYIIK